MTEKQRGGVTATGEKVVELDAVLKERRRAMQERNRAEVTGIVASGIGFVLLLVGLLILGHWDRHAPLGMILCLVSGCGLGAFPFGAGAGLLAHAMFYRTAVPVMWITIAFALIADLSLMGWILVVLT